MLQLALYHYMNASGIKVRAYLYKSPGVCKKLQFLTARKHVAREYMLENKLTLDPNSCLPCGKAFLEGQELLWGGCDNCLRWYHKKCAHNPQLKKF